jgi:hypothetical protein
MLPADRGYDARDLAARLPVDGLISSKIAPPPIKSQQFDENYFRQIGIWMLLATSPICDRRLILP